VTENKIASLNKVERSYILNTPCVDLSRVGHEAVYTGK